MTLSKEALSFFEEEEEEEEEDDDERKKKKKKDSDQLENIIYNKSSFDGNFIIILNTFDKKELADAEAQNLIEKGYKSVMFYNYLDVSNSEEEICPNIYTRKEYQDIGFEREEEANALFKFY